MTAFETPWFLKSKTTEVGRSNQAVEDRLQRAMIELELKQRKTLHKIDEQMGHVRAELRNIRSDVDFSTDLDENGHQIDLEACRSKSTGDVPGKPRDPKHLINSKGSKSATAGGKRGVKAENKSNAKGFDRSVTHAEKSKIAHKKIVPSKPVKNCKEIAHSETHIKPTTAAVKLSTGNAQKKKKAQNIKPVEKEERKEKSELENASLPLDETLALGTTDDDTNKTDASIDIALLRPSDLDLQIIKVVNRANYALSLPHDKDKSVKKVKKIKKDIKSIGLERSQTVS